MSKPATSIDFAARKVTGERIRRWRAQRGYSQYTLARIVGVTQAAVSKYETGKELRDREERYPAYGRERNRS